MSLFESELKARDGIRLYVQGWQPEKPPKAVVYLVHGFGEHSGRYAHVASFLNQAGYAVLSFDLRGHGKSEGIRGHIPSYEVICEDVSLLLEEGLRRYPRLPRFLYGHSLGGMIVLYFALSLKPELAGVVSTSPALCTALDQQIAKVTMAKVLGSVFPKLSLPAGLDPSLISRDPKVVEIYINDPLVHGMATLGMAKNSLAAPRWIFDHAGEWRLPLLLVHGSEDKITRPGCSERFASLVKNADCTMKIWQGLAHETHNEPEQAQVLAFMCEWLDHHLPVEA